MIRQREYDSGGLLIKDEWTMGEKEQFVAVNFKIVGTLPASAPEGQVLIHVDTLKEWVGGNWRPVAAPLASPAFTGTPTAPTAAPGTNTTQIATTAFAAALGALKANIASPTFTGTPAAPTASAGTNTTQISTCAFVTAAIANLIGTVPGALDTLQEIDAAINNDASFAATITTQLALKAPLASPALTGTPTAPTAAAATNTTQVATTAYVVTALGSYVPTTRTLTGSGAIQIGGSNSAQALSGNLTISIVASSASVPGSMSAAHYTLVNGATAAATNSTLVLRDGSGGATYGGTLSGAAATFSGNLGATTVSAMRYGLVLARGTTFANTPGHAEYLGAYANTFGFGTLELEVAANNDNRQVSFYIVSWQYDETASAWYKCYPINGSQYNPHIDLECRVGGGTATFRLRQSTYGDTGADDTFNVSIRDLSKNGTWTTDSTTASGVAAPTGAIASTAPYGANKRAIINRILPEAHVGTTGDAIEIGYVSLANSQSWNLALYCTGQQGGGGEMRFAKTYRVMRPVHATTGQWELMVPEVNSGPSQSGADYQMECYQSGGTLYFRLRALANWNNGYPIRVVVDSFNEEGFSESNTSYTSATATTVVCPWTQMGTYYNQGSGLGGCIFGARPTATKMADADIPNGFVHFYLDESGHNLKFRVRYSSGTLKTGTLALV